MTVKVTDNQIMTTTHEALSWGDADDFSSARDTEFADLNRKKREVQWRGRCNRYVHTDVLTQHYARTQVFRSSDNAKLSTSKNRSRMIRNISRLLYYESSVFILRWTVHTDDYSNWCVFDPMVHDFIHWPSFSLNSDMKYLMRSVADSLITRIFLMNLSSNSRILRKTRKTLSYRRDDEWS